MKIRRKWAYPYRAVDGKDGRIQIQHQACAPAQSQNKLQASLLKELIHKAFSGSGKELVMAALHKHVSQEEREEIRKFLHGDER
ncbi:BlaI/MecI/CopY family transcriptional regulator [Paraburkholderia strydomiana]|uniref:BlaI/MecI/CopY family transcriptional regulator n=1 Tax=Paraburkholderia strydomiana TaxID=1245417 RepID=UPI0038B8C9BA